MAGIPVYVGSAVHSGGAARISFFLKMNTLFSHQTALVDIDGGGVGFLRVSWDPTQYLMGEAACGGASGFINLWPPTSSPPVNEWMWISVALGQDESNGLFRIFGQVYSATTSPGPQSGQFVGGSGGLVSCGLGWGVPMSSTYNPFPNALGDEMTELVIETSAQSALDYNPVRSVPNAPLDLVAGTDVSRIIALYHCDVPLGANQVIKDATANHYDLSPGPANGDLIVHDSPF